MLKQEHANDLKVLLHHPALAIILTQGGKEGARDAAWCNPSEGHHASRLNNVFPMPCQTFGSLCKARQPLTASHCKASLLLHGQKQPL